jgi:alkanesulfonate monooxygenase SsuD/methylene tetrahydromethanopterin reductase-like flavin-dependent oxidoreductase (luciferase family)
VGLAPRPANPIPIWFGGNADAVLRRVARIGDGWFPLARPGDDLEPMLERLDHYLAKAGRSRAEIGIEGFVNSHGQDADRTARQIEAWRAAGATHVSLRTGPTVLPGPRAGVSVGDHIDVMRRVAEAAFR